MPIHALEIHAIITSIDVLLAPMNSSVVLAGKSFGWVPANSLQAAPQVTAAVLPAAPASNVLTQHQVQTQQQMLPSQLHQQPALMSRYNTKEQLMDDDEGEKEGMTSIDDDFS
jgi:hypothetical protein